MHMQVNHAVVALKFLARTIQQSRHFLACVFASFFADAEPHYLCFLSTSWKRMISFQLIENSDQRKMNNFLDGLAVAGDSSCFEPSITSRKVFIERIRSKDVRLFSIYIQNSRPLPADFLCTILISVVHSGGYSQKILRIRLHREV